MKELSNKYLAAAWASMMES